MVVFIRVVTVAFLGLAAVAERQAVSSTLRDELKQQGLSADAFPDASQPITGHAVHSDDRWFAIAYYWRTALDALPDELRVRTYDRFQKIWRETVIPASLRQGGAAQAVIPRDTVVYVALHINPSAGDLLVLDNMLKVQTRLGGWPLYVAPDGRAVYHRNMVHFAPFHAATVSLYDPQTGNDTLLVPAAEEKNLRAAPKNRTINAVEPMEDGRIRIIFSEENLRWRPNEDRTEPVGPLRKYAVTCRLSPVPACGQGR